MQGAPKKSEIAALERQINELAQDNADLRQKFETLTNILIDFSTGLRNLTGMAQEKTTPLPPQNSTEKGLMSLEKPAEIDLIKQDELARLTKELEECEKRLQEAEKRVENAENQLAEQNIYNEALKDKIQEFENSKSRLENELKDWKATLATCSKDNERLKAELEDKNSRIAEVKETLPEIDHLASLRRKLDSLEKEEKSLLESYYNVSSMAAFLAGAGQFSRLEQLFDVCAGKIRSGQNLENLAEILETILHFYNRANPESQAAVFHLQPGEAYNYARADRIGPNGRTVQKTLFPGLTLPNGAISRKCLVTVV